MDIPALLSRLVPRDAVEAKFVRDMLDLAGQGEGAASRGQFTPGHFTATCFVVYVPSNVVLLHLHKRLQKWLPMGGHMDPGEEPAQAALREGAEESGLQDLELLSPELLSVDIHPIPAGKGEPDHLHFDLRFAASTRTPQKIRMDEAESSELEWVEVESADSLLDDRRSLARLRALLRPLREQS
ncbi:MAG TPA: NUDIX domain-containing protein [Usitatibacter sp.]|nr:NUDIX domain-containing protein [Usitatibacter sp.]